MLFFYFTFIPVLGSLRDAEAIADVLGGISLLSVHVACASVVCAGIVVFAVGEKARYEFGLRHFRPVFDTGWQCYTLTNIGTLELCSQGSQPLTPALISSLVNLRYTVLLCAMSTLPDNRL